MSPVLVQDPIKRALYGKLAGDGTLTAMLGAAPSNYAQAIYNEVAPEGFAFPYVIFNKQSGMPVFTFADQHPPSGTGTGPTTIGSSYETELWQFRAIDKGTVSDTAEAIAKRIDELLTDANLSISGQSLMYLRREGSALSYSEVEDGVRIIYRGALYRLIYQ